MDLDYVRHSVQGPILALVAAISIGLVAMVIAGALWHEKKFQAGKEDEH